jgi:bifunctional DNase/RNase
MSRTVLDVSTRVRSILKDGVDPNRYSDADILNAINDALIEARRVRPDLFLKKNFIVPVLTADADKLPIEDTFFNSIVYFAAAYMMFRDDEFSVDSRASQLMSKATGQLIAVAA